MSKLAEIQQALKAPKGQYNNFGKYAYRSCEDILEAVKPLLGDHSLLIGDSIVEVGGRVYVKASARLVDSKMQEVATVTGYAREADEKKGMDAAQVTGAASSYARKYALNGLFCIDDNKDADATNDHGKSSKPKNTPTPKADPLMEAKEKLLQAAMLYTDQPRGDAAKWTQAAIKAVLERSIETLDDVATVRSYIDNQQLNTDDGTIIPV